MEPRAITTLSFGVIGTLIDFETGIREWFHTHFRDQGRSPEDTAVLAAFADSERRLTRAHPELSFTALLPRIYGDIARAWELDTDEAAALDLRDSIRNWPAFGDAINGLRQMREHYSLIAVTSADHWALEAMSNTLGDPFDLLLAADTVGASKPDASVWQALIEQSGAPREAILHCADSQFHDLIGAHGAGLFTARIERHAERDDGGATPAVEDPVEPDVAVTSLTELIEYLQARRADDED